MGSSTRPDLRRRHAARLLLYHPHSVLPLACSKSTFYPSKSGKTASLYSFIVLWIGLLRVRLPSPAR
jgi:hypothetical protein